MKCPSIATAVDAVNSLHGRWFAGKTYYQSNLCCVNLFFFYNHYRHWVQFFTIIAITISKNLGRVITAAYVPLVNYHSLFPDAMSAVLLLLPSAARRGGIWTSI